MLDMTNVCLYSLRTQFYEGHNLKPLGADSLFPFVWAPTLFN